MAEKISERRMRMALYKLGKEARPGPMLPLERRALAAIYEMAKKVVKEEDEEQMGLTHGG